MQYIEETENGLLIPKDNLSFLLSSDLTAKLIAPFALSYLICLIILPATLAYRDLKDAKLENDLNTGFVSTESLEERAFAVYPNLWDKKYPDGAPKNIGNILDEIDQTIQYYLNFCTKHNFHATDVGGLETLEISPQKYKPEQYSVVFGGNMVDAMDIQTHANHIRKDGDRNYIFWNYPGVANSAGSVNSPEDLINAGYMQVMRLIDSGVDAKNITLDGQSLGGAVAIGVAARLHAQGYYVNLHVDRSFSSIAIVPPSLLKANHLDNPLITSLIFFGLFGISVGIVIAGITSAIAQFLQSYKDYPGIGTLGNVIGTCISIIGNIIGGLTAIAGLLAGITIGLCLGTLLSMQYMLTKTPYTLPMQLAFSIALNASLCEMNSKKTLDKILKNDDKKNTSIITGTTTENDEVIVLEASLEQAYRNDSTNKSNSPKNITFSRYSSGGHTEYIEPNQKPYEVNQYPSNNIPTSKN